MSKLTSRAQVEEALHGLRGRPRSIIIQCPASQAPLLRDIVLGLEGFELHPFDIATLRPYQRDEIARAIYNRMFRSDTTPIVYLSTEPVRFLDSVLRRTELFDVWIEAEPA